MKTISIIDNFELIEQHILDFNQNIFINIYFSNGQYCFRLCQIKNNEKTDPYSQSQNFSWAYGVFNSLDHALGQARSIYFENIKTKMFLQNQDF